MGKFVHWDQLLREYVNGRGRVDYARWRHESARELDAWLEEGRTTDLEQLSREEAIAFLINLYNALTIQQVLQKYPIESIRPSFLGIPNWIAFLRFFTKRIYTLKGESLSLNAIEHNILRKRFEEPRIHFALVCASEGCPLIRPGAYFPEQLEAQLAEDAVRFINNPDKVTLKAIEGEESKLLYCSKIFKWYEADFLKVSETIPEYIDFYYSKANVPEDIEIAYLPYSWQLNQRMSS